MSNCFPNYGTCAQRSNTSAHPYLKVLRKKPLTLLRKETLTRLAHNRRSEHKTAKPKIRIRFPQNNLRTTL